MFDVGCQMTDDRCLMLFACLPQAGMFEVRVFIRLGV